MGDSIRTETLRHEQAKLQLEHQKEKETRDLREKQRQDLDRLVQHHQAVKNDIEKAYEVDLSSMRDDYQKRLGEMRSTQDKSLEDEKIRGEEEIEKTRNRFQQQLARYRENSKKMLDDLRQETENAAVNIKARGNKPRA
jgi:hypothetical protein